MGGVNLLLCEPVVTCFILDNGITNIYDNNKGRTTNNNILPYRPNTTTLSTNVNNFFNDRFLFPTNSRRPRRNSVRRGFNNRCRLRLNKIRPIRRPRKRTRRNMTRGRNNRTRRNKYSRIFCDMFFRNIMPPSGYGFVMTVSGNKRGKTNDRDAGLIPIDGCLCFALLSPLLPLYAKQRPQHKQLLPTSQRTQQEKEPPLCFYHFSLLRCAERTPPTRGKHYPMTSTFRSTPTNHFHPHTPSNPTKPLPTKYAKS